jgi:arylsulfatase A-like enzyme
MTRRDWLASVAYSVPGLLRGAAKSPNIVLILADDLGYGDLGCYGQEEIATPHLDQLASEGMRFTQAYAGSSVCSPSRCCLMTGMHNGHGRLRDNLPHGVALQPDDVTMAEVLKQAGYQTGAFGKWHLGDSGTWGTPLLQGFDEFFGYRSGDHAHFYYPQTLWDGDNEVILDANRGGTRKGYSPDLFNARAIEFMNRNQRRPFFLYLANILPHWSDYERKSPMSLDVPSDARYANQNWPEVEKRYAAMVTRLDRYVGDVMASIKKLGLEQDTIVLFASDNGPSGEALHRPSFFRSGGAFRGVKRDLYEGGIRVPLVARWPGRIAAGKVCSHACALYDLLPTAAELAGLTPPRGIDGISILPALTGRSQPQHEYFYWDYGHVRETYKQAVRVGEWKGVRIGARSPLELYHLGEDPGETRNVAAQALEVAARLEKVMAAARTESPDYPIRELKGP